MSDICEHDWPGSSCPECRIDRVERTHAREWLSSRLGTKHVDEDHVRLLAAYGSSLNKGRDGSKAGGSREPQPAADVAADLAADGYHLAFYELAKIMGIGARAVAPGHVWRSEMMPRILRAFA